MTDIIISRAQPEYSPSTDLPQPEELWQHSANQAIDEDVGAHQVAGQLKGLKATIMKEEKAWPQEEDVEKAQETCSRTNNKNNQLTKAAI